MKDQTKRTIRRLLLPAAAAVILPLALASCAPDSTGPAPVTTSSSTPVATPTQTQSSAPTLPADAKAGDPIPADAELADGQYAYPLGDGTTVLVNAKDPIPDVVVKDIQTKVDAIPAATRTSDDDAVKKASLAVSDSVTKTTGRRALVLVDSFGGKTDANDNLIGYFPNFTFRSTGVSIKVTEYDQFSRDAAIAYGKAWIAKQPDADNWIFLY